MKTQHPSPEIDVDINEIYKSEAQFNRHGAGVFNSISSRDALNIAWIETQLGPMVAICDLTALYLLEFIDRKNIHKQVCRVAKTQNRPIHIGRTQITDQISRELDAYFNGTLQQFETPMTLSGTDFQKSVWQGLMTIPYGQTASYSDMANRLGKPTAIRACASANANNGLAIIIPCHRVISKAGALAGYAGGLSRKQNLLELETGLTIAAA